MAMDYSRLQGILKANGTTLYKLSAEKIIGGKTREVLFGRADGNISSRTVEALCKRLHCQPGDFMTYVPEGGGEATGSGINPGAGVRIGEE